MDGLMKCYNGLIFLDQKVWNIPREMEDKMLTTALPQPVAPVTDSTSDTFSVHSSSEVSQVSRKVVPLILYLMKFCCNPYTDAEEKLQK